MDWRWWKRRARKLDGAEEAPPQAAIPQTPPRPKPARAPAAHGPMRVHPAFQKEALRRAWQQVKANGGGPGVDGLDIATFEAHLNAHLAALQTELSQGTYRPQPVRRVLIPKRNEGLRPLAIWTLRDRVAQRAVLNALEPIFEPQFLDCSHGYRPGRSTQTASDAVVAARNEGLRWVLDADIQDCFDSIDPVLLMQMLRQQVRDRHLLRLVELWLQARILSASGQVRAAGAAQGGVLSPLLSNIYLHPFDVALTRQGLRLVRYADDFVVLCRRRWDAEEAQTAAEGALKDLRLQLNPHKTRVVHCDQGFRFLGRFFVRDEVYDL